MSLSGLGDGGAVGGSGSYCTDCGTRAAGEAVAHGAANRIRDIMPAAGFTSGAGNRGFINNVAFPGASLTADQSINPPIVAGTVAKLPWILAGVAALVIAIAVARRYLRK